MRTHCVSELLIAFQLAFKSLAYSSIFTIAKKKKKKKRHENEKKNNNLRFLPLSASLRLFMRPIVPCLWDPPPFCHFENQSGKRNSFSQSAWRFCPVYLYAFLFPPSSCFFFPQQALKFFLFFLSVVFSPPLSLVPNDDNPGIQDLLNWSDGCEVFGHGRGASLDSGVGSR